MDINIPQATTCTQATKSAQDRCATQVERGVFEVGFQSWTKKNLLVKSNYDGIIYYTTRWDALCPYVEVSEEMLAHAKKPFIVYGLPPDSDFGNPIRDLYGMAETQSDLFWHDERRGRKFKELEKLFRNFSVIEKVVPGSMISVEDMISMGGYHFKKCEIVRPEIEGFLDYVRKLDVLIIQAYDHNGALIFTDVSILMPHYNQIYGSFCQWNPDFKSRSPGIYACLAACKWAMRNGFLYYNMGPVSDYEYKSLFVTRYEPIYSLVLTDLDHPLSLDKKSPLYTDFKKRDWNKIYRKQEKKKNTFKHII